MDTLTRCFRQPAIVAAVVLFVAASSTKASTLIAIDTPSSNATITGSFLIGGWAIDPSSVSGTGIDAIHVYAYPNPGSGQSPIFLGVAAYGGYRPDVANAFGFSGSSAMAYGGYNLATSLTPGYYMVVVFARSSATLMWTAQTVNITAASGYPCSANPYDNTPDGQALQACLDNGGTIALIPEASPGYLLDRTLYIRSGTVLTSNGQGRVTFRQVDSYTGYLLTTQGRQDNFTLSHLRLIGNGDHRTVNDIGGGNACGYVGQNANLWGNNFLVDDVESTLAICGSGLLVRGEGFEVRNSYVHYNGRPATDGIPFSWSDGLTVGFCTGCWIHNNILEDNTDIDLVVGGGVNGRVEDNQISNPTRLAFGGLHVGWFPGPDNTVESGGNHSGAVYQRNTISAARNGLSFGLIVGFEPWALPTPGGTYVTNAGSVINNTISGAVVNLAIDGIFGGYVNGNSVSNNQGDQGFACGAYSAPYTAHFVRNATIQSGWVPHWFFASGCGTWNPGIPGPEDSGALSHDKILYPGQVKYSDQGQYDLKYQTDGNLVLYNADGSPRWWTGIYSTNPGRAEMQIDGNFVVYDASGQWYWNTGTWDNPGAYMVIQDDGNLVLYSPSSVGLWASETAIGSPRQPRH